MARIYLDGSGNVLCFWRTDALVAERGPHPATVSTYDFDEGSGTNPALAADIQDLIGTGRYTVTGSVLRKDGSPVTVAADRPQYLQSSLPPSFGVRLRQDRSTTLNSYQDVTGLALYLEANKSYWFRFVGAYSAAAGTTGLQLALNGPAFSFLAAAFDVSAGANAAPFRAVSAAYDVGVNATASGGATPLPFTIDGNVTTTAGGLLVVRGRSEVAGSQVTIRAGSMGYAQEVR